MCSVEGCEGAVYCRGICQMHYSRFRKYGSFSLPYRPTHLERLVAKIDARGDCWLWTGAKDRLGYGRFNHPVTGLAHRALYLELVGEIPDGLSLDHLCRNTSCVNPDHLQPVTHAENMRRGVAGHQHRVKTHCPKGHPYSGENLIFYNARTGRLCRTCQNEATRARRKRMKEAA